MKGQWVIVNFFKLKLHGGFKKSKNESQLTWVFDYFSGYLASFMFRAMQKGRTLPDPYCQVIQTEFQHCVYCSPSWSADKVTLILLSQMTSLRFF